MNINNKSILITGGTGSFGKSFARFILENYKPKKLIIFSRNEFNQFKMRNDNFFIKYHSIMRYFLGDIRDLNRLTTAFKNIDIVVHAAALKHVDVAEYNPFEFIKTNIEGTKNVIEASIANKVKKVITLSTDKASSPVNLYGATKLCADKMVIASNIFYGSNQTILSVVRYGNVASSNGSVIPLFTQQYKKNKSITVTDLSMTRFSIELSKCVKFVDSCIKVMKGSEIFVPKMSSYRLVDLVNSFGKDIKINIIGRKYGEKIHEELISENESTNCVCLKDLFVILQNKPNKNLLEYYSRKFNSKIDNKIKIPFFYSSNSSREYLTLADIKRLVYESSSE